MKEITEKSLQNLWDYCQEAYDDDEQGNKFFEHVDKLLGHGDVDFDLVMDFVHDKGIKRVTPATRAKTVLPPSKPVKKPRSMPAYPGDSCESRTGGCDAPIISPKRSPRKSTRSRYSSGGGCGGSNPSC